MTTTQIPIVPRLNPDEALAGAVPTSRGRHLVSSEALELQGFPANWTLPSSRERAFACFGNAVHVGVVHDVAVNWLFGKDEHAIVDAALTASNYTSAAIHKTYDLQLQASASR